MKLPVWMMEHGHWMLFVNVCTVNVPQFDITVNLEISRGFYSHETLQNGNINLSFTDMSKPCPSTSVTPYCYRATYAPAM